MAKAHITATEAVRTFAEAMREFDWQARDAVTQTQLVARRLADWIEDDRLRYWEPGAESLGRRQRGANQLAAVRAFDPAPKIANPAPTRRRHWKKPAGGCNWPKRKCRRRAAG